MTQAFTETIFHIADQLIDLSQKHDADLTTWAAIDTSATDAPAVKRAGFITKPTDQTGSQHVVDVQTAVDGTTAVVRTWATSTTTDENQNERFDNIQLTFSVDLATAQQLVEQGGSLNRSAIRELLHVQGTQLARLVLSDRTGRDNASQELLGTRYDLEGTELTEASDDILQAIVQTIPTVLARLQQL